MGLGFRDQTWTSVDLTQLSTVQVPALWVLQALIPGVCWTEADTWEEIILGYQPDFRIIVCECRHSSVTCSPDIDPSTIGHSASNAGFWRELGHGHSQQRPSIQPTYKPIEETALGSAYLPNFNMQDSQFRPIAAKNSICQSQILDGCYNESFQQYPETAFGYRPPNPASTTYNISRTETKTPRNTSTQKWLYGGSKICSESSIFSCLEQSPAAKPCKSSKSTSKPRRIPRKTDIWGSNKSQAWIRLQGKHSTLLQLLQDQPESVGGFPKRFRWSVSYKANWVSKTW